MALERISSHDLLRLISIVSIRALLLVLEMFLCRRKDIQLNVENRASVDLMRPEIFDFTSKDYNSYSSGVDTFDLSLVCSIKSFLGTQISIKLNKPIHHTDTPQCLRLLREWGRRNLNGSFNVRVKL